MTSGEVTHRVLKPPRAPRWQDLGSRCLHLTWAARGAVDIAPLGLTCTSDPTEADFILAHGVEALGAAGGGPSAPCRIEELEDLLRRCAPRGPLMIVANPDIVTVAGCAAALHAWPLPRPPTCRGSYTAGQWEHGVVTVLHVDLSVVGENRPAHCRT